MQLSTLSSELRVWIEIIQGIASIIAIAGTAMWSFFVFVLGRSYAPNIRIQCELKAVVSRQYSSASTLAILKVNAKNIGRTRVMKRSCKVTCVPINVDIGVVAASNTGIQRIDPEISDMLKQFPEQFEVLNEHDTLEPGEEVCEDLLIHVGNVKVFKVSATFFGTRQILISKRPQQWTSYSIVVLHETPDLIVEDSYEDGS